MNDERLPPALRALRDHLTVQALAVLAAVALILGLSGPFGTYEALGFLPRLAYWLAVTGLTYAVGFVISATLRPRLRGWRPLVRAPLVAAGVAAGVAAVLTGIAAAMGTVPDTAAGWAESLGGVYAICLCIEAVGEVFDRRAAPETGMPPPILSRLPFDRRGALHALAAADHYVEVTTAAGRSLVLMRLTDAIAETRPVAGLRVHRAHWVALEAVRAVRRQGEGAVLVLADGSEVPVSRSRIEAVRRAGLLPAR